MKNRFLDPYKGVFDIARRYWREYGGLAAVLLSPYFHVAVVLTLLMSRYWQNEAWWDVALGVLPNIIGFAVGGYAIWMGFGDESFRRRISQRSSEDGTSPYLTVSAAFAHFVVVQLLALLGALMAKAAHFELTTSHWLGHLVVAAGFPLDWVRECLAPWFWGLGFLVFVYGLMTAFAATFAIFRVADWFVRDRNTRPHPPAE